MGVSTDMAEILADAEKLPAEDSRPILIGVNGVKGSGKDTYARAIKALVESIPPPPGVAIPAIRNSEWAVRRDGFADRLKLSAANALGHLTTDVDDAVAFCNSLKGEKPDGSDVTIEVARHEPNGRTYRLQVGDAVSYEKGTSANVISKVTGRRYMQYYGTEAHRDVFGKDFWINRVLPNREVDGFGRPKDFFFGRPYDPTGTNRDGLGWQEILVIPDVRFDDEAEAIRGVGGKIHRVQRDAVETGDDGHASEQPLMSENVDVVIDNNGDFVDLFHGAATALFTEYGFETVEIDEEFVEEALRA